MSYLVQYYRICNRIAVVRQVERHSMEEATQLIETLILFGVTVQGASMIDQEGRMYEWNWDAVKSKDKWDRCEN